MRGAYPPYEKKKGGQLTALILAKTHRIRIFSYRDYAYYVFPDHGKSLVAG
ncbi:hypothetical protein ACNKHV_23350 [Shigella flexneri]